VQVKPVNLLELLGFGPVLAGAGFGAQQQRLT
jgi:hypothetical protein